MPTSGDRTSRDFAVMTTRRIWSADDKRRIVDEASRPGANISRVARRNGVGQSLLYRWRKEAAASGDQAPKFVAVALPPPEPQPPNPKPRQLIEAVACVARPASLIEVVLVSGHTLRVTADVDPDSLSRIIAALAGKS